jgi:hypothetical protein
MDQDVSISSGEWHLGYSRADLLGVSFYHLLHPDSMRELQSKHRLGELLHACALRFSNETLNLLKSKVRKTLKNFLPLIY